jgi:hypothetical protein
MVPQLLLYRNAMYMHRKSNGLKPCPQLRCSDEEVMSQVELESYFSKTLHIVESPPPLPRRSTLRAQLTCRGLSLIARSATLNLWRVEGGSKNQNPVDTSTDLFPSSLSASQHTTSPTKAVFHHLTLTNL